MEIAYYPGCSLHGSSLLYDLQCKRIFKELGIDLHEIEDWNCCGATSAGKVDDFLSAAMPARNLGIAEDTGLTEMVIPCSACYSNTLIVQKKLEDEPQLKEEINAELEKKVKGFMKISTILEVLVPKVESGELASKVIRDLTDLKPACYYGCMLTRFPYDVSVPDDVENPQGMETILKALKISPIDWSYKTDCCGASSALNDQQTAFKLMARIVENALAVNANCLVVVCPLCQLNLDIYQDEFCKQNGIAERLPIYFITELIGLAMGISPQELLIDRHFTESVGILKDIKLL